MTLNNFLHNKAIYSIDVCKDHIDLCTCGSVLTIYPHDPDFHLIKQLVYEAKQWATKKQDVYNYIEWCIDNGIERRYEL